MVLALMLLLTAAVSTSLKFMIKSTLRAAATHTASALLLLLLTRELPSNFLAVVLGSSGYCYYYYGAVDAVLSQPILLAASLLVVH